MRSPLEKGAAKGRDRLPRRGRTLQNGKQTYGITGKRPRDGHATMNCASSRHSILRLWRGPSSRACSVGGKPQTSNLKPKSELSQNHIINESCLAETDSESEEDLTLDRFSDLRKTRHAIHFYIVDIAHRFGFDLLRHLID